MRVLRGSRCSFLKELKVGCGEDIVNSLRLVCWVLRIFALSVKRVEDPCQQFSTVLSDFARIRFQRQTGRRPLSRIFDAFVGEFLLIAISHKWAESPC